MEKPARSSNGHKKVHLKLSGSAQAFMEEMLHNGLTERDVLAKALGILEQVWRTGRVCLAKENQEDNQGIEFFYSIDSRSKYKMFPTKFTV